MKRNKFRVFLTPQCCEAAISAGLASIVACIDNDQLFGVEGRGTLNCDKPDPDRAERNRDPLVIDLDGDRQVVLDGGRRSVYFDMNSDGFAERSAWIRPSDALLAIDSNGDGVIKLAGALGEDCLGNYQHLQLTRDAANDNAILRGIAV
jgi:hypothetical protein